MTECALFTRPHKGSSEPFKARARRFQEGMLKFVNQKIPEGCEFAVLRL